MITAQAVAPATVPPGLTKLPTIAPSTVNIVGAAPYLTGAGM